MIVNAAAIFYFFMINLGPSFINFFPYILNIINTNRRFIKYSMDKTMLSIKLLYFV